MLMEIYTSSEMQARYSSVCLSFFAFLSLSPFPLLSSFLLFQDKVLPYSLDCLEFTLQLFGAFAIQQSSASGFQVLRLEATLPAFFLFGVCVISMCWVFNGMCLSEDLEFLCLVSRGCTAQEFVGLIMRWGHHKGNRSLGEVLEVLQPTWAS